MIYLGVDPAFRKYGFGMCSIDTSDRTVKFINIRKVTDLIGFIQNELPLGTCKVCVENSNLQNITFDMSGNKAEIARKSRNVGANQAVSQITVDLFREYLGNANVLELSPYQKGRKCTLKEMQGAAIQLRLKLPYFDNQPSQDNIDAFFLALRVYR